MQKVEILETVEIKGKIYPKHVRRTFIDEPKPTFTKNSDISENIFSDENFEALQMDKNRK